MEAPMLGGDRRQIPEPDTMTALADMLVRSFINRYSSFNPDPKFNEFMNLMTAIGTSATALSAVIPVPYRSDGFSFTAVERQNETEYVLSTMFTLVILCRASLPISYLYTSMENRADLVHAVCNAWIDRLVRDGIE